MWNLIKHRDNELNKLKNRVSFKLFNKPYVFLTAWEKNEVKIQLKNQIKK